MFLPPAVSKKLLDICINFIFAISMVTKGFSVPYNDKM